MTFAPLTAVDRAQLLRVWNEAAEFDRLTPELLAEKLDREPARDESLSFARLEEDAVIGWATCVLRESADGVRGVVKMLAVAPQFQGRGHGSALLAEAERRLAAAGARTVRPGESAPNYLVPGVDVRYTRCLLMLEARGYRRLGETYNLTVPLQAGDFDASDDEQALAANSILVRRAKEGDRPALFAWLDRHWPAWRGEVQEALARPVPAVHLALNAQQQVVAFAAHDGNNHRTGWFGPMGTDPEYEGRGLGRVLLRRCLQDIQRQGLPRAIVPWVGPVRFYAKHAGATIERVFYRYEKTLAD